MNKHSYLSNGDVAAIEKLYDQYIQDNNAVDTGWKKFFEGFEFARTNYDIDAGVPEEFHKEFKVINLINGFRQRGHLFTKTNPVRERRKYLPTLDIENFGLEKSDLDTVFQAGTQIGIGPAKLSDIIAHLKQTYCQSIGVEYLYIRSPEVVNWLREKMEKSKNTPDFSVDEKKHILNKLSRAVAFERFLHTKFVGQKRFSLEGCETFIPALDAVIEKGAQLGIEEFVIGMSHRGRLNVLTNIFNKSHEDIFAEFEGTPYDELTFGGDVKYHLGFSSDIKTTSGLNVHLSLSANPSHLESVDPVVEGVARAKIDNKYNGDHKKVAPMLIHGDASIAAQGIVYEVVQMSQLDGYKTGGTVHIVLNNQIGFTTNYLDGRSSTYCTDVAKVTLSPVFHVNADDVEAVVFATRLAMEFRQEFHRDVFIDLLGYRKHGHNEGDEPKFTQPLLYKVIETHPDPGAIYRKKLIEDKFIDEEVIKRMEKDFEGTLQHKLDDVKTKRKQVIKVERKLGGTWSGKRTAAPEDFYKSPSTAVNKKTLLQAGNKMVALPGDKNIFRKIRKLYDVRRSMLEEGKLDWAMGELMAYATLLNEGFRVRISGQDVERGTFSHRHSVINYEDGEGEYIPLNHISDPEKSGAKFEIYNSLLSEFGVLGFEYGYASVSPNRLIIWEAQFGDFSNEAQVIIDQYISCAEDKWLRQNGLVMLLPHGYEGQGAEHSSARIERFLQLCAKDNLQIVNCTTPANFFHVLRRQLHRDFCKPLVVFTPKSLLRHPKCVSPLDDFTNGGFREVIDDVIAKPKEVKKVVFCSGKIFYELCEKREVKGIAIVRIEQLYPFPKNQLSKIIAKYKNAKAWYWVQEEPQNMGAWQYILQTLTEVPLNLISRPPSATPATGSSKMHKIEQIELFEQAFEKSFYKEKEIKGYLTHFKSHE